MENLGSGGTSLSDPASNGGMSMGGSAGENSPSSDNLLNDPGFESGTTGWVGFGTSQVVIVRENVHAGQQCLGSVARADSWMGPSHGLTSLVIPGQTYTISAWLRVADSAHAISVSTKTVCPGVDAGTAVEIYQPLNSITVTSDWIQLRGLFTAPTCNATDFQFYFEGPPASVDFFVDDVEVTAAE